MVAVKLDDLSLAFEFVGAGAPGENNAYISLDTGEISWTSEMDPMDEDLPDDRRTSDRYLSVPHKTHSTSESASRCALLRASCPGATTRLPAFSDMQAPMPGSRRCSIPKALSIGGTPTRRSRSSRR